MKSNYKSILPFIMAAIMGFTGCGKTTPDDGSILMIKRPKTLIGTFLDKNDAVLLDGGSSVNYATLLLDSKINIADGDCGILIDSDALTVGDAYQDAFYIRNLYKNSLKSYNPDIDLPFYINIDHILDSASIDNNTKKAIIGAIFNTCSDNGISTVALATDKNLCYAQELGIEFPMACPIVEDKDNIKYSGNYNSFLCRGSTSIGGTVNVLGRKFGGKITLGDKMYYMTDAEGNIPHNPKGLVQDRLYTTNSNDWREISKLCESLNLDISATDLLRINGYSITEYCKGLKLHIPGVRPEGGKKTTYSYTIDVSENQGELDETARKYVDDNNIGIIFRSSIGSRLDNQFKNNLDLFKGKDIGLYHFVKTFRDDDPNCSDEDFINYQKEQIKLVNDKVPNTGFFAIDLEDSYLRDLDSEQLELLVNTWIDGLSKKFGKINIYCNEDFLKYMIDTIDIDEGRFDLWLANWGDNAKCDNIEDLEFREDLAEEYGTELIQVTSNFVGAPFGRVDVSVQKSTEEYFGESTDKIEFPNKHVKHVEVIVTPHLITVIAGGVVLYAFHRKRKKRNGSGARVH